MNDNKQYSRIFPHLIILSVILCLTTLFMSGYHDTKDDYLEATKVDENVCDSDVSADADGYLNGRWNLWEFIGDFFSGMIE